MAFHKLNRNSAAAILRNVARSIKLTENEQQFFLALLHEKNYKKKQYILSIGEVCRQQSFVVKGCLRIFYLDDLGNEHIAKFAIEDWWAFDIGSFYEATPAFYGISCLEDTTVLQLSWEAHEELLGTVPAFERFYRSMLQTSFIALQHRMTQSLALTAEERYEQFRQKYPGLEARISQRNVAAYLGITPVFLSMLRKKETLKTLK